MTLHPRLPRSAVELVMRFEGLRLKAARLQDGGWTIGYGHTVSARKGAEIGADDAETLLLYDLSRAAIEVEGAVHSPLNDNQFGALAAFVFSVGADRFRRSDVLKRLNEGAFLQAAAAIELWRRADFEGESIVVDALVRRRAAEKLLFLTPPDGFRPISTPVVRPDLDRQPLGDVAELAVSHDDDDNAEVVRTDRRNLPDSAPVLAARSVIERLNALLADDPLAAPRTESEPEIQFASASFLNWGATETQLASPEEQEASTREPEPVSHFSVGWRDEVVQPAFEPPPAPPPEPPVEVRQAYEPEGLLDSPVVLALGVFGAVLFVAALTTILFGGAGLGNMILGVVGVFSMIPAALKLLTGGRKKRRRR